MVNADVAALDPGAAQWAAGDVLVLARLELLDTAGFRAAAAAGSSLPLQQAHQSQRVQVNNHSGVVPVLRCCFVMRCTNAKPVCFQRHRGTERTLKHRHDSRARTGIESRNSIGLCRAAETVLTQGQRGESRCQAYTPGAAVRCVLPPACCPAY